VANAADFCDELDTFLAAQGFHSHMARNGFKDGHAMRSTLAAVKTSSCAMDGCCVEINIRQLLIAMKNVPTWTDEHARSALEAAEFALADYEL